MITNFYTLRNAGCGKEEYQDQIGAAMPSLQPIPNRFGNVTYARHVSRVLNSELLSKVERKADEVAASHLEHEKRCLKGRARVVQGAWTILPFKTGFTVAVVWHKMQRHSVMNSVCYEFGTKL
jgi:hypothetical protein